jgi:NAD(P)-dependent dehydrogenase (short-subunit alcohol dehydrogenase family)
MGPVLVTGAAGGMGQALCRLLAGDGLRVLAVDHNAGRLSALAEELGASVVALAADLAGAELEERVKPAVQALGGLQGLVNLAGISQGDAIERLTDEDWERSFAVNVTAAMRLARACTPWLKESGRGSIVNVASPVGLIGARKPSYAASKAALLGLTMSLARNLGRYNIRVNSVLPGATVTFLTEDWPEEKRRSIAAGTFLGRLCEPIEVARVIRFLLSEEASYVTGATLDATAGGMYGH